jgi:hypothetical protein
MASSTILPCNVCGKVDKENKWCKGCLDRTYCCEEHQHLDWNQHKFLCKPNLDTCAVCGTTETLKLCGACLHRQYCCAEHQKEAWREHRQICKVYQELGLQHEKDAGRVAKRLILYYNEQGPTPTLSIRLGMELLTLGKHHGLEDRQYLFGGMHIICTALVDEKKFSEAEIFARDLVQASVTAVPDDQCGAASKLVSVLRLQERLHEALVVCVETLDKFKKRKERNGKLTLLQSKSLVLHALSRREEALRLYDYCVDQFLAMNNVIGAIGAMHAMAPLEYNAGKRKDGRAMMDRAIEMARLKAPGMLSRLCEERKNFVV